MHNGALRYIENTTFQSEILLFGTILAECPFFLKNHSTLLHTAQYLSTACKLFGVCFTQKTDEEVLFSVMLGWFISAIISTGILVPVSEHPEWFRPPVSGPDI